MNILVICQYYYPEPFRITDICEELVKRGHEVSVVTGIPNYPMGKIYDGYRYGKKRDEVINGVKVHRSFTVGRKDGVVKRFLNYFSYPISASLYIGKLKENYDVVYINQLSPVMMVWPAIKYKNKYHKRAIMYCLDLWPASLCAGGILEGSLIYRIFHCISASIYRQMDLILNTSKSFGTYQVKEFGIDIERIKYLPQYAETIFSPERCKKHPDKFIDLMFAGNVGYAQCVSTIIKAAALVKNESVRWHIVGNGADLENCQRLSKNLGLSNVFFYGRRELEDMPGFYAMADAMLVTMQKDEILAFTLPGKIQSYMSAAKPILAAAGGETERVICDANCGFCCEAENSEMLANIVLRFLEEDRDTMAQCSRNYYLQHFQKEHFFEMTEKFIQFEDHL